MPRRSKGMAAFAEAFTRSLGMGARIAAQQQRLGAEMAWRESTEKTRQREREENLTREGTIRKEDLERMAGIRQEDIGWRGQQAATATERFEKTLAHQKSEGQKTRASAERRARARASKSGGMDRWRTVLDRWRTHSKNATNYVNEVLKGDASAVNALQILNGEMANLKNAQKVSRQNMSRARDLLETAIGGANAKQEAEHVLGIESLVPFMD